PRALLYWLVLPLLPCALAWWVTGQDSTALRVVAAILLAVPLGPLIERVALRPIARASGLSLLIVSLVLDLVLAGLGLLWFGPEGLRTKASLSGSIAVSQSLAVNYQTLMTIGVAIVLAVLFYVALQRTRMGKVLHATASNPTGARLVGIR